MLKFEKNDPFTYLKDSHNAINEYFKLKQQLSLTPVEQFQLKLCGLYKGDDVRVLLIEYIICHNLTLTNTAKEIGVCFKTLRQILNGSRLSKSVSNKVKRYLEGL